LRAGWVATARITYRRKTSSKSQSELPNTKAFLALLGLVVASTSVRVVAQEVGTAGGRGGIMSFVAEVDPKGRRVDFAPRYAFAYVEGRGAGRSTWIVLTEKEPPVKTWAASKDRAAARNAWCQNEKAAYVAVKLDARMEAALYFLCPAGASWPNTEMVSTANGLKSVVVELGQTDGKRLKGTLRGGEGNCPSANGKDDYCNTWSDYTFDAPMLP